ncbi:hypothetical protein Tco_1052545, partial [Tanacetum coccineum]
NQEQVFDYEFWTDSYASDDDEILMKQVSQDIMEEMSHHIKLINGRDFLNKVDIVWESRKEILVSPHPQKTTPLVQSCQRYPEAPALSLINQDLLWVNKCVKKFNPYARYGVEHWKNPHAKIYEPMYGIIYKNSKKEKRVMIHSEIHKFCDATLIRVLEGLKSYNNDVKYGYVQRELMNDEVEYLKLFKEDIELRMKYRNQMRRWEILAMSSDNASSTVTYTSISSYSNGLSWGIPLVIAGELLKMDPYEEVAQQGQAHPLSPAYVPDPIELDENVPVYVLEPEHSEYHVPTDDDIQVEDQPYADDASSTSESPGHIDDSESMEEDSIDYLDEPEDDDEDPEEDPEEDHTDDPTYGEDGDDEPSDDDDNDEEPTEDEEEEEHIAPADSYAVPVVDPVPSGGDTEAFENDESAPTPRSP